jgi:hypothetical protein
MQHNAEVGLFTKPSNLTYRNKHNELGLGKTKDKARSEGRRGSPPEDE